MANRREMQLRRANLRQQLVEACSNGTLKSGDMLPPLRELGEKYGVSPALASEVVRGLAEEGLLYTLQGAGTFVGRLATRDDLFLLIVPDVMETDPEFFEMRFGIRNGFESSLTRLGGTCLTLNRQKALEYHAGGHLPGLVGVAEFCSLIDFSSWNGPGPLVTLHEMWVKDTPADDVFIDNEDAGRQATQHLLDLGHRQIAFLGVHQAGTPFAGTLDWSRQREIGWQSALQKAEISALGLSLCPPATSENSSPGMHEAGVMAGRELAPHLTEKNPTITAVVISNGHSTEGLMEALRDAQVPEEHWPAIVSFDDYTAPSNHLLSVLRPSWEELGRQGGSLLWERVQGRLTPESQHRPVSMELIPRFSCRPQRSPVSHQVLPATNGYTLKQGAVAA